MKCIACGDNAEITTIREGIEAAFCLYDDFVNEAERKIVEYKNGLYDTFMVDYPELLDRKYIQDKYDDIERKYAFIRFIKDLFTHPFVTYIKQVGLQKGYTARKQVWDCCDAKALAISYAHFPDTISVDEWVRSIMRLHFSKYVPSLNCSSTVGTIIPIFTGNFTVNQNNTIQSYISQFK